MSAVNRNPNEAGKLAKASPPLGRPVSSRAPRPRRADVRRRLLDAALQIFAEQGFSGASLDEVASAAGLTKGAIYSNFASKDELFFAMMSDQVMTRIETIRAVLGASAAGTDSKQALVEIGRMLTEAFTEQREWELVLLDFWRRAVADDEVRPQFLAHRRALRAAIAESIEQVLGRSPAVSGLSVEEAVTVVLALFNGLAIEKYVDPDLVKDDLLGRVLAVLASLG
ncbi:MAG: TetR/AcrR family transcriptional regulator [Acidimicrobiales bacterium]|jgi:AcrR family transcriptional regulator